MFWLTCEKRAITSTLTELVDLQKNMVTNGSVQINQVMNAEFSTEIGSVIHRHILEEAVLTFFISFPYPVCDGLNEMSPIFLSI